MTIEQLLEDYKEPLEYSPSYAETEQDIVQLLNLYWVSQFKGGDSDLQGEKMLFYNILRTPCFVASKAIDLDTKDIQLKAESSNDYYRAWLASKELNAYMKRTYFGRLLNDIAYKTPKYGSIVLKKVGNNIHSVPLQNIIHIPTTEKLDFPLFERHRYTLNEFEKQGKKKGWKDIEDALEWHLNNKRSHVIVYEAYMNKDDYNYHLYVMDEGEHEELSDNILYTLYEDNVKELPYKEHHWEKIDGRWLGRGRGEDLFENQIAKNENEYYFHKGLQWTSLHVFQGMGNDIGKNLLKDVENGEILQGQNIGPIQTEERNLSAFNYADQKWDLNTDDKSFAHDINKGRRPVSGVPLGTSLLQSQQAGQFYKMKRDEMAMFIKEVLTDWILPSFANEKSKEHELLIRDLDGSSVDIVRKLVTNKRKKDEVFKMIMNKGRLPDAKEREMLEKLVKRDFKAQKGIKIPKNFYKNLDYNIDILITSEQIDKAARLATTQTVFQILASNPQVLQNPTTKKVFYKMLDLAGISPTLLDDSDDPEDIEDMARRQTLEKGGSIAAPAFDQTPRQVKEQQQV